MAALGLALGEGEQRARSRVEAVALVEGGAPGVEVVGLHALEATGEQGLGSGDVLGPGRSHAEERGEDQGGSEAGASHANHANVR